MDSDSRLGRPRAVPDGGSGLRILYVTNTNRSAGTLTQGLEQGGESFDVTTVADPQAALDRLESADVDCVVGAYELPETDGLAVFDRFNEEAPDLPFVLLTDGGNHEVVSDALAAGVTDWVDVRHLDGEGQVLATRIENAVARARARAPDASTRGHRSALFENSPDPVVEVRFDGQTPVIETVNAAFEDVFGFEAETVAGRGVADLLVPEGEQEEHLDLRETVFGGTPVETEVRRQTSDGSREFKLRIIPIDTDEVSSGAYAWYTDVTEERQYTERLETLAEAGHRLMAASTATAVAEIVVEVAEEVLDQPLTAMWAYDADDARLVPLAASDVATDLDSSQDAADIGPIESGSIEMEIFRSGRTVVLEDYQRVDNPSHPETPLGTVMIVPLGEYGQLNVGRQTVTEFEASTRKLIHVLCQTTEAALERVHRERILSELTEVTHEMVRSPSTDEIAERAVEAGTDILGLPFTHIYLTDEDGVLRPAAETESTREHFGDLPSFPRGEGLLWHVLESGEPQLYDDVQAEAEVTSDMPFRGAVVAPLGERGVVASGSLEPAKFDVFDRKVTSILAGTMEVALDRADRERRLRENERELKAARDRFQSVFDHSNDAIVIFDPETHEILEANPRAAELLGYPPAELLEMDAGDIHPEEMEAFRSFVDRVRAEESGRTGRLSCTTAAGQRVPAEISASLLEFDGRESILALIRDVSELRAYEAELERHNERLEAFASTISHDLRNPLNVAMSRIELAEEDVESEHLGPAASALDRMASMIEGLLALARAGETVEETEAVALDPIVEGCWRNVDTGEATLTGATEMTVLADEGRLRHVFENLFRNAIDHSDGPVEVTVGALADDEGFYVADDGPGIPPDERDDVFEHGYTTSEEGTGFGLSIVREIVEAHGWQIRVIDAATGGARFEITSVDLAD